MKRRDFHRWVAAGTTALAVPAPLQAAPRPRAPFKLLYSNDTTNITTCVSPWHQKKEPFREEMLVASVQETAGTGVDAHFLQPGLGCVPMWPSQVEPLEAHYAWIKKRYGQDPDGFGRYVMAGGDVVKVFLESCRKAGQAAFISLRMNDVHHKEFADTPEGQKPAHGLAMSVTKFYHDHPEWRIKQGSKRGADVALNWAVPQVVQARLALIEELVTRYDLDGLELDFMRFYNLFRLEETSSAQRRQIVTEFVAKVRSLLDLGQRQEGRAERRWLCIRIPSLLKALDPLGMDLPALHAAGVDMFNLSQSYFTVQQTDFAAMRKQVPDAAFYLEMCHTTWTGERLAEGYDVYPFRRTTREEYQTTAHLAYERGATGVSLFNFAYYRDHGAAGRGPFREPPFEVLKGLTQPGWLAGQTRQTWFISQGWNNPFVRPPRIPRELQPGKTTGFAFDMAPPKGGWQKDARLRLQFKTAPGDAKLTLKFNGTELTATADVSEPFEGPDKNMLGTPEQLRAWTLPAALMKNAVNKLEITLAEGAQKRIVTVVDIAC